MSLVDQGLALFGVEASKAARQAQINGMLQMWDRKASYLNMPIWSTMWFQVPGVLNSSVNNL